MTYRDYFTIGPFAILTIIGAMTFFLWMRTFVEWGPEVLGGLTTSLFFIVAGLSFSMTMVGVKIEPFFFRQFVLTIFLTCINFVVIFYINQMIPLGISRDLSVLVGIGEEVFFTLFLCGIMYRMTHNEVIAIVGSASIWSVFHIAVYQGDFNMLLIVFFCGCWLRATFLFSRSIDSCVFAHGLVNWFAV